MKAQMVGLAIRFGNAAYQKGSRLNRVDIERLEKISRILASRAMADFQIELVLPEGGAFLAQVADAVEAALVSYEFDDESSRIVQEGLWALRSSRGILSFDFCQPHASTVDSPIEPVVMRRRRMLHKYPFKGETGTIVRVYRGSQSP